jgi:hypothetical protein
VLQDFEELLLDQLIVKLDEIKTSVSSFVQQELYAVLNASPRLKKKQDVSFSPGVEKITIAFKKDASDPHPQIQTIHVVGGDWNKNADYYTLLFTPDVPPKMSDPDNFTAYGQEWMVSRRAANEDDSNIAALIELRKAAHETHLRSERAREDEKVNGKKLVKLKRGRNKQLSTFQASLEHLKESSAHPPCEVPSAETQPDIDFGDDEDVGNELFSDSETVQMRQEASSNRETSPTPTPFNVDEDSTNRNNHSSKESEVSRLNLDDYNTSPNHSPEPVFKFTKGKPAALKKRVVDDDDASEVGRAPVDPNPPTTVIEVKAKARKAFVPYSVPVDVMRHQMEMSLRENKSQSSEALVNTVPTSPQELDEYVHVEGAKADTRIIKKFLMYVRQDVEMQLELEDELQHFILRKAELHHISSNEIISPGQIVVCGNLGEVTNQLKKRIVEAMAVVNQNELDEMNKQCHDRIVQYDISLQKKIPPLTAAEIKRLLSLFSAEVTKELNSTLRAITVRTDHLKVRVNQAITKVLTRVTVTWAQVTKNVSLIPTELLVAYGSLTRDEGFKTSKINAERDKRLVDCVIKSNMTHKALGSLMVQLSVKNARANLITDEDYVPPAKKNKTTGSSSKAAAGSGKIGAPPVVGPYSETAQAAEALLKQTTIAAYYGSSGSSTFLSTSSTPARLPDDLASRAAAVFNKTPPSTKFHNMMSLAVPAVRQFDTIIQIVMRVGGFENDGNMYLAFDPTGAKLAHVVARLKLLRFLLSCGVEGIYDGKELREAFQLDDVSKLLMCTFCVKSSRDDRNNIKPDGYCFYRVLYQLYRRFQSDFTLSVDEMSCNDRRINSSVISTPEDEEFKTFYLSLVEHLCPVEACFSELDKADRSAFLEAVELAVYHLTKLPGRSISEEEWGNAIWLKFVTFSVSNFSVVPRDNSSLSTRLYGDEDELRQWCLMQRPGLCDPQVNAFLLPDILRGLEAPNFCSFGSAHFFLIDNPTAQEAKATVNGILESTLESMLQIVGLLDEQSNPSATLEKVNAVIQWLESTPPTTESSTVKEPPVEDKKINITSFRNLVSELHPDSCQDSAAANVVDLSVDEEDRPNESEKSVDTFTIEMLQKLVSEL